MNPSEGDIVHYVLDSGMQQGRHRGAFVVNVCDAEKGLLNLRVFTDSPDGLAPLMEKLQITHSEGKEPGTWHWKETGI